ncbi:MAG: hypothetical protein WBN41_03175 [Lysobacterales bacterium]
MKTTLKRLGNVALLGMLLFASVTANAADKFDGSSNLLCAVFNITACVDGLACAKGEARTFDMPEFMTVDFKKESIHVEYDGGKTADSPIKNYQSTENQLIFQGVENDHGWSVAISKKTGRMSVASVGEEVSFTMFGACKAP